MRDILAVCKLTRDMKIVSKRQLQSLLGKLLYVAKIVVPVQALLNRMLTYLRGETGTCISIGKDFKHNLAWFIRFWAGFNDSITFRIIEIRRKRNITQFEMYNVSKMGSQVEELCGESNM